MPQDSEDLITDWQRRAEQQAALTQDLSQRMRNVTGCAESADSEVIVTVDHSGSMCGLRLEDRAMRLTADELAEVILTTSQRAQAQMAQRVADLVKSIYGSDSPTAAFITDTYTEQFPAPPDTEETRGYR